jgi:hyaluronate lyase
MRMPLLFLLAFTAAAEVASADDFDVLRLRWREILTGGTNLDLADPAIAHSLESLSSSAQSLWNKLVTASDRTYLWADLASTSNSAHITSTYDRLKTMALAYATRGTSLEGNAALRADLLSALDWMNANRYNKDKSEYGNWWDWEVGAPLALNDITVLLYEDLSSTQVSAYMSAVYHFTPKPTKTAANRVWQSTVVAVRGVIVKSSSQLAAGRDGLSQVFAYATSGDGFYTDGSFIQHDIHPYTGGYGNSLLGSIVPLMHLLEGSPWQVTDPKRANVFRWIYGSYQPLLYNGAMMDMVRGREISRVRSSDHYIGANVIASILRAAQFAPSADAAAFNSMAKYWIEADTARDFVGNATVPAILLAREVLDDTNVAPRGELIGHFQFPRMDRIVHLRPGFGLGLSMSSARIGNYESINKENVHGWYTGEGMTYLYNGDLAQFSDNFWPTVNPYRLPGTTVDTRLRANASGQSYRSSCKWVGGTSLGGYGVAGMQLDAWNSSLVAKKSWFMFDDEIVALGAGITCSDSRPIETIIENRKLTDAAENPFTVNGELQPVSLGWSATVSNVSWAHLAGNVPGADLGYYFPRAATVNALREARTNAWSEINGKSGPTNLYTRNYLTLWLGHGTKPANATYAYVLLPNKTSADVEAYAASPDITILTNSTQAQAVRESRLNLTAVNFWNDSIRTVGGITVDRKAAVIVQANGAELAVAVSDPTQANSDRINVTLPSAAVRTLSADTGVTVVALSPKVKLAVNVKYARGRSFRARFELPAAPTPSPAPIAEAFHSAGISTGTAAHATLNQTGLSTDSVTPLPKLNIQFIGSDAVMLSWPANYAGYNLQVLTSPSGLDPRASWTDLLGGTSAPVILTIDKAHPAVFYRLNSP